MGGQPAEAIDGDVTVVRGTEVRGAPGRWRVGPVWDTDMKA